MANAIYNTNKINTKKDKKGKSVKIFLIMVVLFIGVSTILLSINKSNEVVEENNTTWSYYSPVIDTDELNESIYMYQNEEDQITFGINYESFVVSFVEQVLNQIVENPQIEDELIIYVKNDLDTIYFTIQQNDSEYYTNYAFSIK